MVRYLLIGFGLIFLVLGVFGFFMPMEALHLTPPHNVIHLVTGVVFLLASLREKLARLVAVLFGIAYVGAGVAGLLVDSIFGWIMSTATANTIHIVVGLLTLGAGLWDPISQFTSHDPSA
jgi:hypothetical protein